MKPLLVIQARAVTAMVITVAACFGAFAEVQSPAPEEGPPNIVLILADDLGWGDISTHGGAVPTPNIDKLFEEGVNFTNFMGWSLCSPSRAMLLTARHPFRLGFGPETGGELDAEETTIAEAFSAHGYRTGVFGKWHTGRAPDTPKFRAAHELAHKGHPEKELLAGLGANEHGFDEAWVYYLAGGDHFTRAPDGRRGPVSWWHNREYRPQDEGYTDDLITQRALEFIRASHDRPFFCFVSFHAVHTPLQAKRADLERLPDTVTGEEPRLYGAMVLAMDGNVRRLLDELDRLQLDHRTIVVFSSDNGATRSGSNSPFRGNKSSYHEGGIRLPTAIRWPGGGLVGGESWEGLWGFLDLFPTLVDMAGFPMPTTRPLDGKNVWPAIRERGASPVGSYYWASRRKDTIRTAQWKLHRHFNRHELYDIHRDLAELENLADAEPEIVAALTVEMNAWVESLGAGLSHQTPPLHLDSPPAPEGEVLEISVKVTEKATRSDRLVVPIARFDGRRTATDFVEFDTCVARGSLTEGFFYSPYRSENNRQKLDFSRKVGIDQLGREQARGPAPRGGESVWEHRVIGLLGGAPGTLPNHAIVFTGQREGTFRVYFDNLRVRHSNGSTTPIWRSSDDTRTEGPFGPRGAFEELRIRAVRLEDLNTVRNEP